MYREKLRNINYKESLKDSDIIISEYIDKELCWFKCETKSNYSNIIKNINDKDHQIKLNPLVIDIINKKNIYCYHLKSPAPMLGLPEQKFNFTVEIKEENETKIILLKNAKQTNIFEDSEENKIEYCIIEIVNDIITAYAILRASQILPGNKHIVYLRNFLYHFLKSLK